MWAGDGPPERPPLLCQLLPAVPACGGHEPVGALPPPRGLAGVADAACGVRDGGRAAAAFPGAAGTGSAGRGAAGDVAVVVSEGGGGGGGEQPARGGAAVVVLAAPGAVPPSL